MEEFTNRLKHMSLSAISGIIDGLADGLGCDHSAEGCAEVAARLRDVAEELFDRDLDSQESYLDHDYKVCCRSLARTNND